MKQKDENPSIPNIGCCMIFPLSPSVKNRDEERHYS
jgi:hypothetical protein